MTQSSYICVISTSILLIVRPTTPTIRPNVAKIFTCVKFKEIVHDSALRPTRLAGVWHPFSFLGITGVARTQEAYSPIPHILPEKIYLKTERFETLFDVFINNCLYTGLIKYVHLKIQLNLYMYIFATTFCE